MTLVLSFSLSLQHFLLYETNEHLTQILKLESFCHLSLSPSLWFRSICLSAVTLFVEHHISKWSLCLFVGALSLSLSLSFYLVLCEYVILSVSA